MTGTKRFLPTRLFLVMTCCGIALLASPAQAIQYLFVSSSESDQILRYDGNTGAFLGVFAAAGSGGLTSAQLNEPSGLALGPDYKLYAGYFDGSGNQTTGGILRFGNGGGFDSVFSTAVPNANDLHFAPDGFLYVSKFNPAGVNLFRIFGPTQPSPGTLDGTFSLSVNGLRGFNLLPTGGGSYDILATSGNKMSRYTSSGAFVANYFGAGAGFSTAQRIVIGPDGKVYLSDTAPGIWVLDLPNGATTFTQLAFNTGFSPPMSVSVGLDFDPAGNLLVANYSFDTVMRFNRTTGAFINNFVGVGVGGLDAPIGLLAADIAPEPGSLVLLAVGAAVIGWHRRHH